MELILKGGTLIELRGNNKNIKITNIKSLNSMNLGDINVKEFGNKSDYLIKVEQKENSNNNLIAEIKNNLIVMI